MNKTAQARAYLVFERLIIIYSEPRQEKPMSEEKPMVVCEEIEARSQKLKKYLFHDGQIDTSNTDEMLVMIMANILGKYMETVREFRHDPVGMRRAMLGITHLAAKAISTFSPQQFIEEMKRQNTNTTTH